MTPLASPLYHLSLHSSHGTSVCVLDRFGHGANQNWRLLVGRGRGPFVFEAQPRRIGDGRGKIYEALHGDL